MKKIITFLSLFILCMYGKASLVDAYKIYVTGDNGKAGQNAELILNVKNSQETITMWQCTLVLPDGVTLKSISAVPERFPENEAGVCEPDFLSFSKASSSNSYEIKCVVDYMLQRTMLGKDSATVKLIVSIPANFKPGDYSVEVKDSKQLSKDFTTHNYELTSFTWTIEAGSGSGSGSDPGLDDPTDSENLMYLTGSNAKLGQTAELIVNLKNVEPVSRWSCVLYLPEGVVYNGLSLATNRYLKETRITESTYNDRQSIAVVCEDNIGFCLTDTEGAIATISVTVPDDFIPGVYNVRLDQVSIASNPIPGLEEWYVNLPINETSSFSWTIGDGTIVPDEDTDIASLNNVIYLNKTEGFVGQEQTLSFQMKDSAPIRGFQFDLYLPDGVTAVKNAKGRIQGALNSGRLPEDDEHTLTLQEQADGSIRFLCSSLYDETFTGSEGEIATLRVKIGDNMMDGDYPIIIKNMKLTETNINNFYETSYLKSTLTVSSYTPGDVNGDTKVDVSDYTGVANHILGIAQEVFIEKAGDVDGSGTIDVSDYTGIANHIMTGSFSGRSNLRKAKSLAVGSGENVICMQDAELPVAEASGAEVNLSLRMRNTADIRGFQFDMYLPDGFSVVKNNKGRIIASLSSGRLPEDDEHTLTVQEQADGAIRFLCSSLYDETFTGTDGEIATVKVKIAENITAGNYPIQLKNIKLTETNISNYYETEIMESVFRVTGGEEPNVCAKPTISYANGKLTFYCETEGVTCQSTITDTDIASYSTNEVKLGVTYIISVYATKAGYENSEVTTATLCWIDQQPDTEGIEDAVTEVKAMPVLIQSQGGTISIQGAVEGTNVSVYSVNGMLQGSAIADKGITILNTSLQPGSVVIVKIGDKSVKVLMK